jgi:hypothetical protein
MDMTNVVTQMYPNPEVEYAAAMACFEALSPVPDVMLTFDSDAEAYAAALRVSM